jgi:hypothetical protein
MKQGSVKQANIRNDAASDDYQNINNSPIQPTADEYATGAFEISFELILIAGDYLVRPQC